MGRAKTKPFLKRRKVPKFYFHFGQHKSVLPSSFNTNLVMWKYNCEPLWFPPPIKPGFNSDWKYSHHKWSNYYEFHDHFEHENELVVHQFTRVKLATKSKMDFRKFPATNNRYISVIPHSAYWIDIWAYKKYSCPPFSTIQSWYLTHYCGPKVQNLTQTIMCSAGHMRPCVS
jgi:hypothetical protein